MDSNHDPSLSPFDEAVQAFFVDLEETRRGISSPPAPRCEEDALVARSGLERVCRSLDDISRLAEDEASGEGGDVRKDIAGNCAGRAASLAGEAFRYVTHSNVPEIGRASCTLL